MKLKKLLRVIEDEAEVRITQSVCSIRGITHKTVFDGKCENVLHWIADLEVMKVTNGEDKLIVEVWDE